MATPTTEHHPILIIGSGFGGAVAAARLTEAGAMVALLERGPWRDTDAIEAAGIENRAPLPQNRYFATHGLRRLTAPALPARGIGHHNGLYDIHYQRELTVVCTSGVGGGSHVYTALNTAPDGPYWDGSHPELSDAAMAGHYDWAMGMMGSREPPAGLANNIFSDDKKPEWMITQDVPRLKMAFHFDRSLSGNTFFGSRDNSKAALDEHLLLPAMAKGLVVKDRHEVLDLARAGRRFRVTVKNHHDKRIHTLTADRVIVAAGTLNTLRLLLASRDRGSLTGLPAMGIGISGNGDTLGYWPINTPDHDYCVGTPCHGRFRVAGTPLQPAFIRCGFDGFDTVPMPKRLRARIKRDLLLVGVGRDHANGLARWHRGRLRFAYSVDANPVLQETDAVFDRIHALSGCNVIRLKRHPLTVHPLGGARVAADPRRGVVNEYGEAHDIPGLFVADASALPGAPGAPPTMTIAAWSSHVATALIARETGHGVLPQAPTAADTSAEPVAQLARG